MKKIEKRLSLALVQQPGFEKKEDSLNFSAEQIRLAAQKGAKLVLLQELHTTYYFCQTEQIDHFHLAEPIPGPSTLFLSALAKKLNIVIVGSIFEKHTAGLFYNTAVVIEADGTIAGKYRKTHIPEEPQYHEKYYFSPGDYGCKPIQTSIGRLGVLVCWDQWYPEAARLMALNGAELLLYPTAIGWGADETDPVKKAVFVDRWITIQRAHAIANAVPVLAANRVGFENDPSGTMKGIHFFGNSFIADHQGQILTQANELNSEILIASVDLCESEKERLLWPFFRDRRVDLYSDLLSRSTA